jgi:hypothetical protein
MPALNESSLFSPAGISMLVPLLRHGAVVYPIIALIEGLHALNAFLEPQVACQEGPISLGILP